MGLWAEQSWCQEQVTSRRPLAPHAQSCLSRSPWLPHSLLSLVPCLSWGEGAVCLVPCLAQNRDSGKGRWDQEGLDHGTQRGQPQEVGAAGSVSLC